MCNIYTIYAVWYILYWELSIGKVAVKTVEQYFISEWLLTTKVDFSSAMKKTSAFWGCIGRGISSRSRKILVPLYVKVVGSDVESQILCPGQENTHIRLGREKWAGVVCVLTKCSHGGRLEERGSFSWAKWVLREHVTLLQKYIRSKYGRRKNTLFKGQHGHRNMWILSHE